MQVCSIHLIHKDTSRYTGRPRKLEEFDMNLVIMRQFQMIGNPLVTKDDADKDDAEDYGAGEQEGMKGVQVYCTQI